MKKREVKVEEVKVEEVKVEEVKVEEVKVEEVKVEEVKVDYAPLLTDKKAFETAYIAATDKGAFIAGARAYKEAQAKEAQAKEAQAKEAQAALNEFFPVSAQPTTTVCDMTKARRQTTQGTAISAVACMLFPDKGRDSRLYSKGNVLTIADVIANDIMSGNSWNCAGRSISPDKGKTDWVKDNEQLRQAIASRVKMHITNCRTPNKVFSNYVA